MESATQTSSFTASATSKASANVASKSLHQKRSFPAYRHPMQASASSSFTTRTSVDSPAYDASEEDNDPLTDSGASVISLSSSVSSVPLTRARGTSTSTTTPARRHNNPNTDGDEGVDSPTYDGDVESSTTAGPEDHPRTTHRERELRAPHPRTVLAASQAQAKSPPKLTSPVRTAGVPSPTVGRPAPSPTVVTRPTPSPPMIMRPTPSHPSRPSEPCPAYNSAAAFDPAKLTPEDIVSWTKEVIESPGLAVGDKIYKINEAPTSRPVRIYADGVYDLFHFGHALQLRQAKLAFPDVPPEGGKEGEWTPGVYLLAGVNSDEDCEYHKNQPVMTHAERCESVRHCRWVDEIVPDAPWVIDAEFLEKHKIDYVAHDADPYGSVGFDDVYAFCKMQGKFLPTRRTPGISTSDLLARLVSGYRHRVFDKKLAKMGMHALMAEGSDYDESRAGSVDASRVVSRAESPNGEREREQDKDKQTQTQTQAIVPAVTAAARKLQIASATRIDGRADGRTTRTQAVTTHD